MAHGHASFSSKWLWPFHSARAFVAHSCADDDLVHPLARGLGRYFDVWCDSFTVGDESSTTRRMLDSDVIVFVASDHAVREGSTSLFEYDVADSTPRLRDSIFLVHLDSRCSAQTSEQVGHRIYYPWDGGHDAVSVRSMARAMARRLASKAGFSKVGKGWVGGNRADLVLETILSAPPTPPFVLAALYSRATTEAIVQSLSSLSRCEKENAIQYMQAAWSDMAIRSRWRPDTSVTMAHLAYLSARISPRDVGLARSFLREAPPPEARFLHRSYVVSMALLGEDGRLRDFARRLQTERSRLWDMHRRLNLEFHKFYYGCEAEVIRELVRSIESLDPVELLELNVVTLSQLSRDLEHIELLRVRGAGLRDRGVEPRILQSAVNELQRRCSRAQ
jgi:hypothetical protein